MMDTIYDVLHGLVSAVFTGELGDLAAPAHEAITRHEQASNTPAPASAKKEKT